MKEYLFYEEELVTVQKVLRNNTASGADSVVSEFFKYGECKGRDKLLKVMNIIFEKGKVSSDFRDALIKPRHKTDN